MTCSPRQLAMALASLAALEGCAIGTQLAADPGDLADYRAYRVAADEGAAPRSRRLS